jgi:GT2 family glycosyltransferase
LESIGQQAFQSKQHVIVDGASTDGRVDLVKKILDATAILKSAPDIGIYDALNIGMLRDTGDVVSFLHLNEQ